LEKETKIVVWTLIIGFIVVMFSFGLLFLYGFY